MLRFFVSMIVCFFLATPAFAQAPCAKCDCGCAVTGVCACGQAVQTFDTTVYRDPVSWQRWHYVDAAGNWDWLPETAAAATCANGSCSTIGACASGACGSAGACASGSRGTAQRRFGLFRRRR